MIDIVGVIIVVFLILFVYLCIWIMDRDPISNRRNIHKCDCKHHAKYHLIKHRRLYVDHDEYYSYCEICNKTCHEDDTHEFWPWENQDLRIVYLPKFQETQYDMEHINVKIKKPLSRKLHIRLANH